MSIFNKPKDQWQQFPLSKPSSYPAFCAWQLGDNEVYCRHCGITSSQMYGSAGCMFNSPIVKQWKRLPESAKSLCPQFVGLIKKYKSAFDSGDWVKHYDPNTAW